MTKQDRDQTPAEAVFRHPGNVFRALPHTTPQAANTNRPGGRWQYPFGYNPKAVAEAKQLAVEAMYLGADILETLKRVDLEISKDLSGETAQLAKTLMFWGVGAMTLTQG